MAQDHKSYLISTCLLLCKLQYDKYGGLKPKLLFANSWFFLPFLLPRYINYYANETRNKLEYKPVKLYLRSIVLAPVPNFGNMPGGSEFYLSFEVKQAARTVYTSPDYLLKRTDKHVQFELETPLLVCSCLLYTSPSPRDRQKSRMPSSA